MMKTLVKPRAKFASEISFSQSYRQNRIESHNFQYRKYYVKWKFLLIVMSFFAFFIISDSPNIDAEICNKFHSEQICKIW